MTPRQAADLREQRYRELLLERYGPIQDLEAERDGPTPGRRRRGHRYLERLTDELTTKEAGT